MRLSRTVFFGCLLLIVVAPFVGHTLWWLAHSKKAAGSMRFVGKSYTGQLIHSYSVIRFYTGTDTIFFNTNDNIIFNPGQQVTVRYQQNNPQNAKVDMFFEIWGDALVYGGMFVLLLVVIFLHPGIVPYHATILVNKKPPFVNIIAPSTKLSSI